MRKLLAWVVYIPLQVALLPMGIVGVLMQAYRQLVVSKRLLIR